MMRRLTRTEKQVKQKTTAPVHQQLTSRLTLWMGLIFAILALLGVAVVQFAGRDSLEDSRKGILGLFEEKIVDEFEEAVQDVEQLAQSSSVRYYAEIVSQTPTGQINTQVQTAQTGMLRSLNDVLNSHLDRYLSVRFITPQNAVWGEVTNRDGRLFVFPNYRQEARSNQALTEAMRTGNTQVVPVVDREFKTMSVYVPVSNQSDEPQGVIQLELDLQPVIREVFQVISNPVYHIEGRRILLITDTGVIIEDTQPQDESADLITFLDENRGEITSGYGANVIQTVNVYPSEDFSTPWRLIINDEAFASQKFWHVVSAFIIGLCFLSFVILNWLLNRSAESTLQPLDTVNEMADQLIRNRQISLSPEAVPNTEDEIGQISRAIFSVSGQISEVRKELEAQVRRRTRDIEIAARIGRETATLYDLDTLLNRSIDLICTELGYYHAQVFLIDDVGTHSVLVASRGETGQKLLALNHKIPVGSQTVIGTVTGRAQPVIINDTQSRTSAVPHGFNPLLPNTRAEMGLPLVIGGKVIGALDVQSESVNAFDMNDLPTFRLLADQIAIAINTARLVSQTENRISQIDTLNRQLTRNAWENSEEYKNSPRAYRYNLIDVDHEVEVDTHKTNGANGAFAMPISIRGEVIGTLSADMGGEENLSEGDQSILRAVAERVALAVENARLFQETQTSLAETSMLYQINRYLNEAGTLTDILQAIIISSLPDAGGAQVWIFDDDSMAEAPEWMEIVADLSIAERDEASSNLAGLRLHLPDHPLLRRLKSNEVMLVNDTRMDSRLDTGLQLVFRRMNARAVIIVPLSVRGAWPGLLMIEFEDPREFGEREGRILNALIDQAGVAVENRLLLEQTEEALSRNENLYAASRIINTAQNFSDLVYAAVATSNTSDLEFGLGLLEGELDEIGWPKRVRMIAQSINGAVEDVDIVQPTPINADSPMRNHEPEVIRDDVPNLTHIPPNVQWIRDQGLRFMAIFPLFSANQPIALFYIMSQEPRELSAEDFEVYRALTGQMSTQIENRRLLNRTAQALDETRRLYTASRAIVAAQDSQKVYYAATEHLARPFLQAATEQILSIAFLMARPEPRRNAPQIQCVYDWSSSTSTGRIITNGQIFSSQILPVATLTFGKDSAINIGDINTEPEIISQPDFLELLQSNGAVSVVVAPIQSRQRWFGVLLCQSSLADAFDEQYSRFVEALADQVALAIENRQLFEEAQNEARRAQLEAQRALALAEAGQLANMVGLDFEQSIAQVFQRVAEAANYDRWMLALVDDRHHRLYTITSHMPGKAQNEQITYSMDDLHPLPMVTQLKRRLMINDIRHFPNFQKFSEAQIAEFETFYGKSIVAPVRAGDKITGAMLIGRDLSSDDLDEGDERLVDTLGSQVAVAMENRRLFLAAQSEQQYLESILSTLPAGVLVLDPRTLKPVLSNAQAKNYLGEPIASASSFDAETYHLFRTGTQLAYPNEELPIFTAVRDQRSSYTDDVAVIYEGYQIDLLVNAAPIHDDQGEMIGIVASFSDISNLRSLENTLQENLRETVAIYEAQRQLSESGDLEQVLDALIIQLTMMQTTDAYILIIDQETEELRTVRSHLNPLDNPRQLGDLLDEDRVIHMHNRRQMPLPPETIEVLDELGVHSIMTIPMRARSREVPLGWLIVMNTESNAFSQEQERILTQLGEIASTAIDNRYLIQSTREALQETEVLYRATTTLSRARNQEQLVVALESALQALSPDIYTAFIVQEQFDINVLVASASEELPLLQAAFARNDISADGIYINDVSKLDASNPLYVDLQAAVGEVHSVAVVPLRIKDAIRGRLIVAYKDPRRFTASQRRYMSTLSDSTSVVLDNIVLVDEIQSTLEETSILYHAGRALNDASTPQDILRVVVDFLIQPHIDQVFIALLNTRRWDSADASVEIVANWNEQHGIDLHGVTLTSEQFPAWAQLGTQSVIAISDVHESDILNEMERTGVQSLDARSLVVIPLRVPKRAIGAVWIGSRQPHRHTDRELRIYQSFGEQASLSMEAAYLLEQTEKRATQLEISAEISSTAGKLLDLTQLLPQVVDLIHSAFNYDHVQIFLMDENDEYAVVRASTGEVGRQLMSIQHRLLKGSESVIGRVTSTGQPTIALDTADATVVHQPNPYLPLTRSEMALPLILKEKVIGALDVQSNQPNAFNEEDIRALTTLAAQISIAIENANLYEEAQNQADRMSFLFEITTAAAAADNVNVALQSVVERLHLSQDALTVAIYLQKSYLDKNDKVVKMLEAVAVAGPDLPLSEIENVRMDDFDNALSITARRAQPMIIRDTRTEHGYLSISPVARSAVIVPMISGTELLGLVIMESPNLNTYANDDVQLLLTMSGSISAIIQSTQLLERLQNANEELRELDRIKSDFLANMSHELRTPLNSIIGFSRVMLKGIDGPLTEMQEQDLTTIYNSGQHLLVLINDILDQAKIAAGKMDLKYAYFEIKPLIESVKSIGIGLLKDKPISLQVEIAPTLPKAYGDEFRTRQVLLNLVSNAAKFTNQGGITIRVYPYPREGDGKTMVRIEVIDTGIGIAEKDVPLLFEAFRQVDSSLTRTQGGTGLGLPIAKSLIEMQGGEMTVTSQVNVGSTFSVTIPTEPAPQSAEDELEEKQVEDSTRTPAPLPPQSLETRTVPRVDFMPPRIMQLKRQILLIEDNPDMVDQFRRILQREGFEVIAASIPLEAEAMASGLRPTIIVMDINFAKGVGWDILKRLKERDDTFDIPVIVVTLDDDSERAYRLGAYTFIQRPFTPEDLSKAAHDAEKESNTERILIIDDQPEAIRLLTQLLDEHGKYKVFSASNGMEGISMVARRRPDLIILDLRMPEKDGFAVLQELRSNPETSNIPVLVVTGDMNLNATEKEQLANVRILQKTDISEDEYNQFLTDVQKHLSGNI